MPFLDTYRQQVALLIRAIPFVAREQAFALKGGTAINLFVRDMPRLSVDIDLTYLPVEDRATSLKAIDAAMLRIAEQIGGGIPGAKIHPSRSAGDDIVTKLIVRSGMCRSRLRSRRSCAAQSTNLSSLLWCRGSKRSSALPKCRLSHLPISMPARSSQLSIASTRATCLMCATFSPTRG